MISLILLTLASAFVYEDDYEYVDDYEEYYEEYYEALEDEDQFIDDEDDMEDFIPAKCGLCVKLVSRAQKSDLTTKEELNKYLNDTICAKVGILRRVCISTVNTLTDKTLADIVGKVEPTKVCQKVRFC
ncbi:hypothetical protein BLNAU_10116 [Blattamonas nauphoetae]|uniref:Saposin B-type domain-containing protein n=1 Tax=Blattamonas nauphoetae TaxID=2049346 RepID=A0ABQ9XU27_9EUKA|nr:hypothetical protein BLNAU_10116 [Blattamonas nauphoetae]